MERKSTRAGEQATNGLSMSTGVLETPQASGTVAQPKGSRQPISARATMQSSRLKPVMFIGSPLTVKITCPHFLATTVVITQDSNVGRGNDILMVMEGKRQWCAGCRDGAGRKAPRQHPTGRPPRR